MGTGFWYWSGRSRHADAAEQFIFEVWPDEIVTAALAAVLAASNAGRRITAMERRVRFPDEPVKCIISSVDYRSDRVSYRQNVIVECSH